MTVVGFMDPPLCADGYGAYTACVDVLVYAPADSLTVKPRGSVLRKSNAAKPTKSTSLFFLDVGDACALPLWRDWGRVVVDVSGNVLVYQTIHLKVVCIPSSNQR